MEKSLQNNIFIIFHILYSSAKTQTKENIFYIHLVIQIFRGIYDTFE